MSRQHYTPNPYAAASPPPASAATFSPYSGAYGDYSRRSGGGGGGAGDIRMPRIFKRLFKFPQMDFEMAVWEMSCIMFNPRKVWRQVMYRKQTKNTYATQDPAFPYLLSLFLLLTSFAWSLAYAVPSAGNIIRIAFVFVFVHCIGVCLVAATVMYFGVWWTLGPNGLLLGRRAAGAGGPGSGRSGRGLFGMDPAEARGEWEFGYCFDVALRSFFPLWVYLYVLQFLLLPAVTLHRWPSVFLGNTLHLVAFSHATYTTFLGYNALPSLSSTQLLLAPIFVWGVVWLVCTVAGWSLSLGLAPILLCFGGLRKSFG